MDIFKYFKIKGENALTFIFILELSFFIIFPICCQYHQVQEDIKQSKAIEFIGIYQIEPFGRGGRGTLTTLNYYIRYNNDSNFIYAETNILSNTRTFLHSKCLGYYVIHGIDFIPYEFSYEYYLETIKNLEKR
jgi:hypothetical protein